ncbi:GPW/gp25 family protein [Pseudovibrio ascidiaceicola]|uniref:GPW/gp25 family protein n=1 Tax=Pseudovibrio ascidiaceicola TaxID=285279 RepID=UPI000D68FB99|nr:GPW/gp25 family protein [Pseudovibrio ascidiaceicola]
MAGKDLDEMTGGEVSGWAHVVQSINRLFSTPKNTRVFLREFGSDLPNLVDVPSNDAGILALFVAVATALEQWEPRFSLSSLSVAQAGPGKILLNLVGTYVPRGHHGDTTPEGETQTLSVPIAGL